MIRIRPGSGLGLGSVGSADPDSDLGKPKKRKILRNFMLEEPVRQRSL
jgi:hypothetical protein